MLSCVVALLAALTLAGGALANPGALDTTFGTRGVTYLPSPQATYWDIAEAPAGQLYVDATQQTSFQPCGVGNGNSCNSFTALVLGLTPSGHVRDAFGDEGVVGLSFAPSAMAVAPNGNVLLAGGAEVIELTPSGTPDTSFGTDGVVQLAGIAGIQAMAVQPNDDLVITGQSGEGAFFAERLTPAGAPDPGFGDDGLVTQQFGSGTNPTSLGTDVIVTPSGELVFAVSVSPTGIELDELTPTGAPDENFMPTAFAGIPGVVVIETPMEVLLEDQTQVAAQPGQGYVVTGFARGPAIQPVPVVARFNLDGTLDTSFGQDGVFVGTPPGEVGGLITRSNGLIDLVWNGELPGDNAIIQLGMDGRPDDSFGPNGVAKQRLLSYGTSGGVLDPAGDLVVLGSGGTKGGPYLTRIQLPAALPLPVAVHASTGRLKLILACRGSSQTDCATVLTLKTTSGTLVARKSVTISGGRRQAITLTPNRHSRRSLQRNPRVVLTLRTGELSTVRKLTLG